MHLPEEALGRDPISAIVVGDIKEAEGEPASESEQGSQIHPILKQESG